MHLTDEQRREAGCIGGRDVIVIVKRGTKQSTRLPIPQLPIPNSATPDWELGFGSWELDLGSLSGETAQLEAPGHAVVTFLTYGSEEIGHIGHT